MVVFFNYDFLFLYYFSSLHFIFIHSHFISFFLFSFSCFSPPYKCPAPLLLFSFSPQEHSSNSFASHLRERERVACSPPHRRWRSRSPKGQASVDRHSPCDTTTSVAPPPLDLLPATWVRLTFFLSFSFLFFFIYFFSYLLVLIQLYFKNWILFCV